jgi:hypothetical protein
MAQNVEAVIISGPRRGEIVQLPEEALPELSDAELERLNAGLDDVIAAIDRLSVEYLASTEALKGKEITT